MCIVYISDLQLPNTDMYISTIRPTDNMEQDVGKLFLSLRMCVYVCVDRSRFIQLPYLIIIISLR